jgi:membrane associated rhomboid family serine protease
MIRIRLGGEEIRLEPEEWTLWVQDGRIPPHAQILTEDGRWVPAGELPAYHRAFRRGAAAPPSLDTRLGADLRRVLFPRRGLSALEILLLVNLTVAAALVLILGGDYLVDVRLATTAWWGKVRSAHAYWYWVPTLFLHANAGHLLRNMVALVAGAGAVEFLMGRRWAYAVYLITGLGGAWLSYAGHGGPPLSIGASGAVFGLVGCTAAFVLRRYGMFTYRQKWKARRVYGPLFMALVLPSILNADYYAHVGGFVSGLILGLAIPPHPRIRELAAEDPMGEDDAGDSPHPRSPAGNPA